jgi:prephenate dehydrogenase (NADP+)
LVEAVLRPLGSRFVHLSYEEHDLVTANTQAVTHAAFLRYELIIIAYKILMRSFSMGTAWCSAQSYPWEQGHYVGGIETAKVNLTLRIYSNLWHLYAGLAILNPSARVQIDRYAASATELFKMMLEGGNGGDDKQIAFKKRIEWAQDVVFGQERQRRPILLSQEVLDRFTLGNSPQSAKIPLSPSSSASPTLKYKPNSHLSLLAMVDCWAHLGINPYTHLSLAATPIFRLFLGVAEHLFLSPPLLSASIHSALFDTWHRADDLEFVVAARGWSQCVSFGNFEVYKRRFEDTRKFFEGRFEEAGVVGSEMIKAVMESELKREDEVEN